MSNGKLWCGAKADFYCTVGTVYYKLVISWITVSCYFALLFTGDNCKMGIIILPIFNSHWATRAHVVHRMDSWVTVGTPGWPSSSGLPVSRVLLKNSSHVLKINKQTKITVADWYGKIFPFCCKLASNDRVGRGRLYCLS